MNDLEKLMALLSKDGRSIKYGVFENETADPLICIAMGESEISQTYLNENGMIEYPTVVLTVYSADYMAGYNLLQALKGEIFNAQKQTVAILHNRDMASGFENAKYNFKAVYKIIK